MSKFGKIQGGTRSGSGSLKGPTTEKSRSARKIGHSKEYRRAWYAQNREHCREYRRKWKAENPKKMAEYKKKWPRDNRQRRVAFRRVVDMLKSKPCSDCEVSYPPRVMEFDHVRGKKKFTISRMVGKHTSRAQQAQILEEVKKCDLVCANCHRLREIKRSK